MNKTRARRIRHDRILAEKRMRRRKNGRMRLKKKELNESRYRNRNTGLSQKDIVAPEYFRLSDNKSRVRLVRFISNIRVALREGHNVFIDFERTNLMVADGTLLFFAELANLDAQYKNNRIVRCNYPKNQLVEQVLQHIGVLSMLGQRSRKFVDHETVKHWCIASGSDVDGSKLEELSTKYKGTFTARLSKGSLYNGLIEAMTNSCQHAYPDKRSTNWWVFSEEYNSNLTIVFCDIGIGIPASIREPSRQDQNIVLKLLQAVVGEKTDGELIRVAFEIGKSKTKEPNRGKGLQEVKAVLEDKGQGKLLVQSGTGFYSYEPKKSILASTGSFAQKIPGTLISWSMPIGKEEDNEQSHN